MNKTKIQWADYTWNPVWGCLTGCNYCYARKISARFGKKYEVVDFKPTWIESNFNKPMPKKPSRIFVNSMSDISYWELDWFGKIFDRIKQHTEQQFMFLTKSGIYFSGPGFPDNCNLGVTVTNNQDAAICDLLWITHIEKNFQNSELKKFISIEPMQEAINPDYLRVYDLIIIGAETGNRKGKIIPEKKWITDIVDNVDCEVILKDSLKGII